VAIPIAFPDYLIHVDVQVPSVNLPVIGKVGGQKLAAKVPQLGHAGVLLLNGASGTTKYYEYGRYPPSGALGRGRKQFIPDVVIGADGHPTQASLAKVLAAVSRLAGQGGRIEAAYIAVPGKFAAMFAYARKREVENSNSKRKPYDLTGNSRMHFAKWTVEATGTMLPSGMFPSRDRQRRPSGQRLPQPRHPRRRVPRPNRRRPAAPQAQRPRQLSPPHPPRSRPDREDQGHAPIPRHRQGPRTHRRRHRHRSGFPARPQALRVEKS
jgi:hypothetical protein